MTGFYTLPIICTVMSSRTALFIGALAVGELLVCVGTHAAGPKPAWVIPNTALVRSGPGQNYDRIASVPRGTKIYVLAFRDKWCLTKLPSGTKGWIAEWLLEFSASKGRKLVGQGGTSSSASASAKPAWVKVSDANVRSGPGLDYQRYGVLAKGTKVYVVASHGDWRKCRTPGGYGWLRRDLLEFDTTAGRKLSSSASGGGEGGVESAKGFIQGDRVRLRDKPSTSGRIVATLDRGQTVYVVDRQAGWYRLRVHGGHAGWVHHELVKMVGEARPSSRRVVSLPSRPDFPSAVVEPKALCSLSDGQRLEVEAWTAGEDICVRRGPSLASAVKTKLSKGVKVTVTGVDGHWVYARLPDGSWGWLAGWLLNYTNPQQCQMTDNGGQTYPVRVGWVARTEVNVRSGPGLDHKELTNVALGTKFIVLKRSGQWYHVAFGNGAVGWIASWLVDTREQRLARQERLAMIASGQVTERSSCEDRDLVAETSDMGSKIVTLARRYLGYPYVRGGESPSGFDCSGFVKYVMKQFGINVSHDSRLLFRQGSPVARQSLQPGDVVFFRNTYRRGISHVGIYIGENQFVHASTHRTGVRLSSLGKQYYVERYAGARRMH